MQAHQVTAPTTALLSPEEVARELGVSEHTLASWRKDSRRRSALPFVRIGGQVRYRPADLHQFVSANVVAS